MYGKQAYYNSPVKNPQYPAFTGTAPLGVTFAILAVLFGLIWGRKRMSQPPVATFLLISYAVATLFFIGREVYWRGLPNSVGWG